MVQLDYDEEMGPLHGMFGLSGGRTRGPAHHQKGTELTVFSCLKKKSNGARVHVDNKGIVDGLRRGESKCMKQRAGDAD